MLSGLNSGLFSNASQGQVLNVEPNYQRISTNTQRQSSRNTEEVKPEFEREVDPESGRRNTNLSERRSSMINNPPQSERRLDPDMTIMPSTSYESESKLDGSQEKDQVDLLLQNQDDAIL